MKKRIVFIVLHYMAINDTVECINSIRKNFQRDSYHTIVVDNCSPDKSGEDLIRMYETDEDITVLCNNQNLGFAKGNNIGIEYALSNYWFDYCAVINNDTLLIENDLLEKLDAEYSRSHFAVLGPMIFTADGRCDSNPVRKTLFDASYIQRELRSEKRHLLAEKNVAIRWIRNIWFYFKPLFKRNNVENVERKEFLQRCEDVQLHGSFLIFSQEYFRVFKGFYDGTFLYHEEEILHLLVHNAGLLTVYQPDIKVFHKEDASTNAAKSTKHEKRMLLLENSVASLEKLRNLYSNTDNSQ